MLFVWVIALLLLPLGSGSALSLVSHETEPAHAAGSLLQFGDKHPAENTGGHVLLARREDIFTRSASGQQVHVAVLSLAIRLPQFRAIPLRDDPEARDSGTFHHPTSPLRGPPYRDAHP